MAESIAIIRLRFIFVISLLICWGFGLELGQLGTAVLARLQNAPGLTCGPDTKRSFVGSAQIGLLVNEAILARGHASRLDIGACRGKKSGDAARPVAGLC